MALKTLQVNNSGYLNLRYFIIQKKMNRSPEVHKLVQLALKVLAGDSATVW